MRRFKNIQWQVWVLTLALTAGIAEVARYALSCGCFDFWDALSLTILITLLAALHRQPRKQKASAKPAIVLSIASLGLVILSLIYLETTATQLNNAMVMFIASSLLLITSMSLYAHNKTVLTNPLKQAKGHD